MPRGDGTGPMGLGPMIGRGRGFGGCGGGRGRRNWYYASGRAYPYALEMTPGQEAGILRDAADSLREQLADIQGRIEALEKAQAGKSDT